MKLFVFLLTLTLFTACKKNTIAGEYPAETTALATEAGPGLPYIVGKDLRPVWKLENAPEPRTLSAFSMTNQLNQVISKEKLAGKAVVVSFFFTKCPGICPMTVKNLRALQEKFKTDDRVVLLSFSITPETDTPAILKKYAKVHHIDNKRWHLLTGARKDIYELARTSFGADTFSPKENARQPVKEDDFLHSENAYLLDQEHRLRGVYKALSIASVDDLVRDTGTLQQ